MSSIQLLRRLIRETVIGMWEDVSFDINIPDEVYDTPRARLADRNATRRCFLRTKALIESHGGADVRQEGHNLSFRAPSSEAGEKIIRLIMLSDDVAAFTPLSIDDETHEIVGDVTFVRRHDEEYRNVIEPLERAWLEALKKRLEIAGMRRVSIEFEGPAGGNPRVTGVVPRRDKQRIAAIASGYNPVYETPTDD